MNLKTSVNLGAIPEFMKAVQGKDFGDIDEMLTVEDNVPVPRLGDALPDNPDKHPLIKFAEKTARKDEMIVKTLAVALAPGDCRVLSGKTRRFQGPPTFPYVPGGDCSGIVVEVPPDETYFKVGDYVAARFTLAPRDCLGEYGRISRVCCEKFDPSVLSGEQAATLASASPATIVGDAIRSNERVLILGANGGIGAHVCQLAKAQGASYVCGVSNDPKRLLQEPLRCDDAIDYTQENVFESSKYKAEPFDTLIDLASGGWLALDAASAGGQPTIVKPANRGGRFLTITSDQPIMEVHSLWKMLGIFMFLPKWRAFTSRIFTRHRLPTYDKLDGIPDTREVMTRTLDLAKEGTLQAMIDPEGPYPMTTEGVRKAFRRLESRHPKGKVVITVAKSQS